MILRPYPHVVFSRFKLLLVRGEGVDSSCCCSEGRGVDSSCCWFEGRRLILLPEYVSFRKGLVTGIIAAGFGFGAAVFSPLQTFIINPGKREGISLDMGILFHLCFLDCILFYLCFPWLYFVPIMLS